MASDSRQLPDRAERHDDHPYVRGALARLANARKAAALAPFPYAVGTPVEFTTPIGSKFGGRVLSCDDADGYVTIEVVNAPAGWNEPILTYHALSWPEHIADNGVLEFRTDYRVSRPREVTARADVARVEHLQQQMGDEA